MESYNTTYVTINISHLQPSVFGLVFNTDGLVLYAEDRQFLNVGAAVRSSYTTDSAGVDAYG
jgi:hypothetical protein